MQEKSAAPCDDRIAVAPTRSQWRAALAALAAQLNFTDQLGGFTSDRTLPEEECSHRLTSAKQRGDRVRVSDSYSDSDSGVRWECGSERLLCACMRAVAGIGAAGAEAEDTRLSIARTIAAHATPGDVSPASRVHTQLCSDCGAAIASEKSDCEGAIVGEIVAASGRLVGGHKGEG